MVSQCICELLEYRASEWNCILIPLQLLSVPDTVGADTVPALRALLSLSLLPLALLCFLFSLPTYSFLPNHLKVVCRHHDISLPILSQVSLKNRYIILYNHNAISKLWKFSINNNIIMYYKVHIKISPVVPTVSFTAKPQTLLRFHRVFH